ncbi:hypothetical protein M422DRAFT_54215 [Sphaerobolus stellatus SS14]|uniref:NADH:flavin oxidoreductase/NADH oxidase N-terminal domain-containing protein n=1 Tax=Sphaerobolus stellatus (strain SS14) TaxID=990650 RepID=A0A0C9TIK8_SPHS4|nr:hypothetical protein M422DRAFT_54215 [Sphaerobolus stellatus SS14]
MSESSGDYDYNPLYLAGSVPNIDVFFPINDPLVGSLYPSPITLKGVTFKKRIFVALMCMYSSNKEYTADWHLVHLGTMAVRRVGAICMEATAVVAEGRIGPEDASLWADSQIPPLQRVVRFGHSQGIKVGVQLAHAGREASIFSP